MADTDFDVMPFKDRLEGYAKANYKSFREFEDRCGLVHSGLSAIGKQGPTLSYLAKIADAIPELNMNWLISGRGEMFVGGQSSASPTVAINTVQTINIGNWDELVKLISTKQ